MTDETPYDSSATPGSSPPASGYAAPDQPGPAQPPYDQPGYGQGQPPPGQPIYGQGQGQPGYGQPGQSYPPPPTGPAGYGPPGYPVYPVQPPLNTYAILALVLAIFVLPPLGIYFGKKAQQQIAVTGERGVELAKAAVVVGRALTILFGVLIVIWCAFAVSIFTGFFGAAAALSNAVH